MARFSTDVISIVAFGFETNSLANPDAEFRKVGRMLFSTSFETIVRNALNALAPSLIGLFKVRSIKKENADFFYNVVNDTVRYREENGIQRNDFLDLLIKIKRGQNLATEDVKSALSGNESKEGLFKTYIHYYTHFFTYILSFTNGCFLDNLTKRNTSVV